MAIMYPKNLAEYMPTDSEQIVYNALKNQLPDSFEIFYSVSWTAKDFTKSESDFIVLDPDNGFLCIEVKGGKVRVEDNEWYVADDFHGERKLKQSPYKQAELSMYHFRDLYDARYHYKYRGTYGIGVVFPFCSISSDLEIDKRSRDCTIDFNDMDSIHSRINRMFKLWAGKNYGNRLYTKKQHELFREMIKENLAIEAASGALVKYKEAQLQTVNRIQDNIVHFTKGIKQFLVRGGAGTGKTWIAIKMARQSSNNGKTLYVCLSKFLANSLRPLLPDSVDVMDLDSLFGYCFDGYHGLNDFRIEQLSKKHSFIGFDAIYVDEAQDLSEQWAKAIKMLCKDPKQSRLAVFFDEVQILRVESFSDGFGTDLPLFFLNENIRNTSSIYSWTSEKTNLGKDVILNPVEGPSPTSEIVNEIGGLTQKLEKTLKKYLVTEHLQNKSLVVIVDDSIEFQKLYPNGIAQWVFVKDLPKENNEVRVVSIEEFKGLEADMVVYIHSTHTTTNMDYVAYTRAKYYLKEYIRNF